MKQEEKQVIEAMKVISSYCNRTKCLDCVFNSVTGCSGISEFDAPVEWELKQYE